MKPISFSTYLLISSCILLLSGCAIHDGTFDSGVAITSNQFRVVGIAEGNAQATYILGFGGLNKQGLVMEAKRDLYSKYPLGQGMVLANMTVDFKRSFFFIAGTTRVTVSADVIDFNPQKLALPYKGFYTEDSTFFPMGTLPLTIEKDKYAIDESANLIVKGAKISFTLNRKTITGVVDEVNNYGVKCRYQTETGDQKIYLSADYVNVVK